MILLEMLIHTCLVFARVLAFLEDKITETWFTQISTLAGQILHLQSQTDTGIPTELCIRLHCKMYSQSPTANSFR